MKILILSFLLKCVLCGNIEVDLKQYQLKSLEKLNILAESIKESSKYYNAGSELQSIQPEEITIKVYTKAHPDGTEIHLTDASKITEVSPFDTKLKTIFYIHGWLDTVQDEGSTMVRDALLESADVNILIVNWDNCAMSIDYFVSKRCVPDVGSYIGQFIETVAKIYSYSMSDIIVVGHSLGAHIGGFMGKYNNGTLGVIVGLDPAGPFYFENPSSARLNQDDADYVLAIHTDASFLGVNFNVGNADFWPNGGYSQNGCSISSQCSHLKAYKYYAESVRNNNFYARQCASYQDFEAKKCSQNDKSLMAGVNINTAAVGNYYLDTNENSPYGMGDVV